MNQDTLAVDLIEMDILTELEKNGDHRNFNKLSCIPCTVTFGNYLRVTQHIKSEEHCIVSLATGISFNGQAKTTENFSDSFPELYFCLLCSYRCFNFNAYNSHLEGSFHKYFVKLLRDMCRQKREGHTYNCLKRHFSKNIFHTFCCELSRALCRCSFCFNKGYKKIELFVSKIIKVGQIENVGDSYAFVTFDDSSNLISCLLCNLLFDSMTLHKQHLENPTHKRMEQFMFKISHLVNGINIKRLRALKKSKRTISNSFRPAYYCELCNCWCTDKKEHIIGESHKRIKELKIYLSTEQGSDLESNASSLAATPHFVLPKFYCKLCAVWRPPDNMYALHLKDSRHQRIECFVNNLTDDEKNIINAFIDAQAREKISTSYHCKLCHFYYQELESYEQHLKSEVHKSSVMSFLNKDKNCQ